jgi:citrate synthase
MATASAAGLRDIIAASSAICNVNGTEGKLSYYGYDIADLAKHSTFEEVIYLLWHGELPTSSQLTQLATTIKSEMELPAGIQDLLHALPSSGSPMSALRTAVSAMVLYEREATDYSRGANVRKAVRLTARIPTIVATFEKFRYSHTPVTPREDLSLAANFLYMLKGRDPDPRDVHAFDVALILHADHELNASTFAGREVASTEADLFAAITAAIAALSGPLHGGANEKVMRMLESIDSPNSARQWITESLERGNRIPGFGHAVYIGCPDPRATALRGLSREVAERTGNPYWFDMSEVVVKTMRDLRPNLFPNVDFYSASLYRSLGIHTDLFTPVFACSRIAGWTAHALEQYAHNRLIRPRAEYVGPEARHYVPIEDR